MLTKLFRTELFHNLDYKSGCASSRSPPCPCCASRCSLPLLRCVLHLRMRLRDIAVRRARRFCRALAPDARGVCGRADAKGYTRGFEESAGYKKGYAAGEKLAREQAANMNQAAK